MARREITGRKPGGRADLIEERHSGPRGPPDPATFDDVDAYSIEEFCRRHRISVQLFYKLKPQGLAPATFNAGTRVLVSKESAARWRTERERATAAEASA